MLGPGPYTAAGYQVLKLETHLHTIHSDGQHGIREMFQACRQAGYDAVALTDHNTQSGIAEAAAIAEELGLVFVPGVEVTTFRGHLVALGVRRVSEWRDLEIRGIDRLAADVHAAGGVVCIAHPAALGSPVCSGCAWDWPVSPESIDLWEVFSASRPNADVPLALWQQLVAAGASTAPIAAGDVHSTSAAARPRIATHVYVRERSTEAVLEALRARRLFASQGEPVGFWLETSDGRTVLAGERVQGTAWTAHVADDRLAIRAVGRRCVYAERREPQGALVAISAPIWIDTSQ